MENRTILIKIHPGGGGRLGEGKIPSPLFQSLFEGKIPSPRLFAPLSKSFWEGEFPSLVSSPLFQSLFWEGNIPYRLLYHCFKISLGGKISLLFALLFKVFLGEERSPIPFQMSLTAQVSSFGFFLLMMILRRGVWGQIGVLRSRFEFCSDRVILSNDR
jgi:hypothetical protein